jgi:hypothetical protein
MFRTCLSFLVCIAPLIHTPALFAQEDDDAREDAEEQELTEADVINFLKRNIPRAHAALKKLETTNYAAYKRKLEDAKEGINEYLELREWSTDMANAFLHRHKLEFDALHLAEKLEQTTDKSEQAKLKAILKVAIAKAFDARLRQAELEIVQLSEEIKETRARIDKRKKLRERIIERRLRELTEDTNEEDLEWEW